MTHGTHSICRLEHHIAVTHQKIGFMHPDASKTVSHALPWAKTQSYMRSHAENEPHALSCTGKCLSHIVTHLRVSGWLMIID